MAKQPVDLCTSGLSQLVARAFVTGGLMPRQIEEIREIYAGKREAMLAALERHIDPDWSVSWTRPEGGLFLWMRLPAGMESGELLQRALRAHVAFVTGTCFHCDGSGRNTLRLNFSYPPIDKIDTAIERLAGCIESLLPGVGVACTVEETVPSLLVTGDHTLRHLPWNLVLSEVVE